MSPRVVDAHRYPHGESKGPGLTHEESIGHWPINDAIRLVIQKSEYHMPTNTLHGWDPYLLFKVVVIGCYIHEVTNAIGPTK